MKCIKIEGCQTGRLTR